MNTESVCYAHREASECTFATPRREGLFPALRGVGDTLEGCLVEGDHKDGAANDHGSEHDQEGFAVPVDRVM